MCGNIKVVRKMSIANEKVVRKMCMINEKAFLQRYLIGSQATVRTPFKRELKSDKQSNLFLIKKRQNSYFLFFLKK